MAVRRKFLLLHVEQEKALKKLFQNHVLDIVGILRRYSDLQASSQTIRKEVAAKTTALFLAQTNNDSVPFVFVAGKLIPLSPYMNIIWAGIRKATELGVQEQQEILLNKLKNAPDVVLKLKEATEPPILEFAISEIAKYDPTRAWKDGYNLSNRIWKTSIEVRSQLDAYLDDAFRSGKTVQEIAYDLEKFLLPGKQLIRTSKPYGKNASFNAMRLARTELTAAFNHSGLAAAKNNPFVEGYRTKRSANSVPCVVCDSIVEGGPYPLDDMAHFPPGSTHPFCLCIILWVLKENTDDIIQQMKTPKNSWVNRITALIPQRFIDFILSFYN